MLAMLQAVTTRVALAMRVIQSQDKLAPPEELEIPSASREGGRDRKGMNRREGDEKPW